MSNIHSARAVVVALLAGLGLVSFATPPASAQMGGGSLVVTVTSPASGTTVGGTIPFSANVSALGGLAVQGVQFKVDGVDVGAEDAAAPYAISCDTREVSNASHVLTAVARDALGVLWTSDPVTVTVFNDNTPPTVAISEPGGGALVAGTTTVTATASDDIGVAGLQFLLDGAPLGVEDTVAPFATTWDTTPLASGSHTVTAVVRDAAGNTATSAPVSVIVSQTATRFENTDLSITYTDGTTAPGQPAGWWHGSRSRGWSGSIASFNRSQGARASFHFSGTTVRWIGFRAPWAGIARVSIDDTFITELDLYQATEEAQAVVLSRTGLANGIHTLMVESTGRKNASSSDYAVVVDAFDVAPVSAPPAVGARTEELDLLLSPGWAAAEPTTRAWTAGTAVVSATAGAQAAFTFVGTEVRWMGLRGPQAGIARVSIDGSFHAQVDLFSPAETEGEVLVVTGLAPATHTLRIEVTGAKNAASTGASVVVDAFDVRGRVEETDRSVTHSAGWLRDNFAMAWSGTAPNIGSGSASLTRTAGAQVTISFTGTAVRWIGLQAPWTGIARVLVDNAVVADVDTYAPAAQPQAVLYAVTGLADGAHTFTVEVTGTRNAASIDSLVIVDAFDVTSSPSASAVTRSQETDPAAVDTASWTQGTVFRFWAGETAAYSVAAGESVTFTFSGTAVRWIGNRQFYGAIARVLLDGVEVAQVDTFAPLQEEFQAAMYAVTGLANTSHTLTIENTGQKNPAAQNTWVVVDAFDVY